jgi:serine/threonine protein kinase
MDKVIGKGGMSTVYRAHDTWLDIYRAVKVLSPELAQKQTIRRRFELEAKTMARLRHPNIVTVHDVGIDADLLYIVMEYIKGGTVRELMNLHGKIPAKPAVQMMKDVCDAIQASHDKGVIHRDVKPHNLLLTSSGGLKVTDFGIARLMDNEKRGDTRAGDLMGTWAYMSPEQRSSAKTVEPRSDVYSIGASLYSMLTNKEPTDLFAVSSNPQMRKETYEGVPGVLIDIIEQATMYHPKGRFETAAAFSKILDEVSADLKDTDFSITEYTKRGAKARRALLRQRRKERKSQRESASSFGLTLGGTSAGTMGGTSAGTMGGTAQGTSFTSHDTAHGTKAGRPGPETVAEMQDAPDAKASRNRPKLVRQTRAPTPAPPPLRANVPSHSVDGMTNDVIVFGDYSSEQSVNEAPAAPKEDMARSLRDTARQRSNSRLARSLLAGDDLVSQRQERSTTPFRPPPTDVSVGSALNQRTHPLGPLSVLIAAAAVASLSWTVNTVRETELNYIPPQIQVQLLPPALIAHLPTPTALNIVRSTMEIIDDPFAIKVEEPEAPADAKPKKKWKKRKEAVVAEAAPPPVAEPGKLFINSVPWSTLSVDGSPIGRTPWKGDLPSGSHALTLTNTAGESATVNVSVVAQSQVRFCWDWSAHSICGSD